jgi:tellurite resistance protein TerC
MPDHLFPYAQYWWFYLAFAAVVVGLLAIDLTFHRKAHTVSFREALGWTSVWVSLALAFAVGLYLFTSDRFSPAVARQLTLEFLAGYVVEESLSVDNMFVFAMLFRFFAIPSQYQHRVLFYGVAGALVFRAVFIAIGSALVQFHWVMVLFGLFLIFTGVKMALQREVELHPGDNPAVRLVRRLFPVTRELHGARFFVTLDGVRYATPLLVVLVVVETTDILFAVDSVPAVFAVTSEPLIVFTSNVFAILGLRSMYFLLSGAMDRFHALKYGLATVLVFVGVKMAWLDGAWGGRFPIGLSLAIITSVLVLSVVVSLVFPPGAPKAAPQRDAQGETLRRGPALAMGGTCLLLSAISALVGTGSTRGLLSADVQAQLPPASFFVSSGCYLVAGVLLLMRDRAARPLRVTWKRSRRRVAALVRRQE